MNPNEIKKALECLCGEELFCRECNYYGHIYYPECRQQVAKDTLAYINQLEAEVKTAKSEAIKEFAERLKENLTGWDTDPTDEEIEYTINNLVKEMVGDE